MFSPLKVLIVEDREVDAMLVLRQLQRSEYDPSYEIVATADALREALPRDAWQVVLADYSMPQFSGIDALRIVREMAGDIPFILVSGAIGEETAAAAMKAGADDYVLKHNLARLGPAIRRELRDAEVRRARRQAEKELQEREALFRSIIENVADVITILDADGNIRYQSPSVERVLGYNATELTGTSGLDYLSPDDRAASRKVLCGKVRHSGQLPPIECRLRHKDGSWRVLAGTLTNLLDDQVVAGIVCNLRDITDQRQLERQLVRAQRMESIGNLAGGIAHDLNNLMTPILVAADMLREDLPEADRESVLTGLASGASRAAKVVDQLLSFAQGTKASRGVARVAEVARETERLLRYSFPSSISVNASVRQSLGAVSIDATQLGQVLLNLCINARDAMPKGGRLTITAENAVLEEHVARLHPPAEPGPFVRIRVVDTGTGIPPEIQERIFDPFFTTKDPGRGTGLGLSTTANILYRHGGFIECFSGERGTRFDVYLPAVTAPEMEQGEQELSALPMGQGEWVLVADDDAAIRELVKETLETYSYRALTAIDGAEAVARYREHSERIELVIMDMVMPVTNGPDAVRAIRALDERVGIILQAGAESQDGAALVAEEDVDAFLEKPYTTEELIRTVREVLQLH